MINKPIIRRKKPAFLLQIGVWICLFLAIILPSAFASTLDDDIISYYTFDDAQVSGALSVDTAGVHNATIRSVTTGVSGKISEAYDFGGGADESVMNMTELNDHDFTVSAWVTPDHDDAEMSPFGTRTGTDANGFFLRTEYLKDNYQAYVGDGVDWYSGSGSFNVSANQHMVTVTYDADADELVTWINGLVDINVSSGYGVAGTPILAIGCNGQGKCSGEFKGIIDEVAVWNRTLTVSEIIELYDAQNISGIQYPFTPTADDTLNITAFYPANNRTFNTPTINFNATISASFNYTCSLYINSTLNQTRTNIENAITFVDFNVTFPTTEADYSFYFNCSTNETSEKSSEREVFYRHYKLNISASDYLSNDIDGWVNVTQVTGGNFSNRSLTTDGDIVFGLVYNGTYNVTFDNSSYELQSALVEVQSNFTNYNFTHLYSTNSINFTFYEEHTETLIARNISIDIIGHANYTYNYSTDNGTLYIDLIVPSNYTIRYSSTGYGRMRHYYFTLSNRSHTNLDLYLLNNTYAGNTTLVVYDELTLNTVENSYIYVQRRLSNNTYVTIGMYQTDIAGKGYFNLEWEDEYYKFLVDTPLGTRRLTTENMYVENSVINLYISLSDVVGQTFYDQESISYSLNYVPASEEFQVTWTDTENVASQFCLYIKEHGSYSSATINSSCLTASSGTIALGISDNQNKTYYALFTATIEGDEKTVATAWHDFVSTELGAGVYGVFLTIVLIMIFAFLSTIHVLTLIFASSALVFAKIIGIITLGWGTIITFMIASLIISILIEMKK